MTALWGRNWVSLLLAMVVAEICASLIVVTEMASSLERFVSETGVSLTKFNTRIVWPRVAYPDRL